MAVSEQLPPVCEVGKQVAINLADCGVRVWGMGMTPRVLTLTEATRVLATNRTDDGKPIQADGGIEAAWSRWFSGARG